VVLYKSLGASSLVATSGPGRQVVNCEYAQLNAGNVVLLLTLKKDKNEDEAKTKPCKGRTC
jgi:hypothetical protein